MEIEKSEGNIDFLNGKLLYEGSVRGILRHMNTSSSQQLEIQFGSDPAECGYNLWRQQRRDAMRKLARDLGLPLEHPVEVWLKGGIRLRGLLRLRHETLWIEKWDGKLELNVDGVTFLADEIESCVRTD